MTNTTSAVRKKQAGFTLVELAVVMIIIGLLIGGVLKGQELIANAQVTGTASAVKGIDAATTTFRDTFASLPGDLVNPARLPNCAAAPCSNVGNGNGRVDASAIGAAPAGENISFWAHLSAADLLAGVNPQVGAAGNAWGANFPAAPIAGGFHAAFYNLAAALGANPAPRQGHYLILNNTPGAAPNGTALTALQGARLDRKLDDGNPTTGTVFPVGGACVAAGAWREGIAGAACDVALRFQN